MINIFLGTNVLISATFWKGSSYKIMMRLIDSEFLGFTTNAILQEYRHAVKRDFSLNEQEIDAKVQKLLEFLEIVSPSEAVNVIKDDPSDNKVLEGALEARADYIITYDAKHLLKIKEFQGITIISPEEFLELE